MIKRLAFALLTLVFGGVAFWMSSFVSTEIRTKRDWPTVPGKILERGVGEPMGKGRAYLPHVKYAYTVEGKPYVGDQVYLIRRTGNLADKIQELVDGLPDPVPVHYNPEDPAQTYLIVNPTSTSKLLLGFGIGAMVLGGMQLVVALARRKQRG